MSKETFDSTRFNKSNNKPFEEVLDANLSRRNVLKGGLGISAMTAFGAFGLAGHSTANAATMQATGAQKSTATLAFESVKGSLTDSVVVPKGYTAQVLVPWGTPLNKQGKAWLEDGTNNAQDQANSLGMHHDGMHFFPLNGNNNDGLLVINHEYIDQKALHANGPTYNEGARPSLDEVRKEINAHGVSVVRVKLEGNQWVMVDNDPLNRRYTGATVMDLSGPVAHSEFTKTKFSQDGSQARGTLNNCGNGYTPWGTYLTCEENWPGYFVNKGETTPAQERIGIATDKTRYGWDTLSGNKQERLDEFARFDVTPNADLPMDDYRNEAHGHGYIVEIDPYTANSRAKKRSALGCFRHEGCTFGKLTEGEPIVFYSGHDSRFEYLYKFVSEEKWDPRDAEPSNRLSAGDKYMDKGTLYVAKFNDDGSGTWLPLTLSSKTTNGGKLGDSFDSQAALIINTAGAADLVAQRQWIALNGALLTQ